MMAYFQSKQPPDPDSPSTPSQDSDRIAAFLQSTVSSGASARDVAELITAAFQRIDQALVPIVGQRGMAALYKRSVHLARATRPWLPAASEGVPTALDLELLTTALAQRTAEDAGAAGAQLLERFVALLSSLIGESLTARLLHPVWATILNGPSDRNPQP